MVLGWDKKRLVHCLQPAKYNKNCPLTRCHFLITATSFQQFYTNLFDLLFLTIDEATFVMSKGFNTIDLTKIYV